MHQLAQISDIVSDERPQFVVLAGLSIGVMALAAVVYRWDRLLFERYLGKLNPVLATVAIVVLGGALLTFFLSRGWFVIYNAGSLGRFWPWAGLAIVLGCIMALVDLKIRFPENMNAPFPESLIFYPVMGYVAEVAFHLLPLSVLLILLTGMFDGISFETAVWPCILIVSLIEGIYQSVPMVKDYSAWAVVYVGFHIFAISLAQLWLFKSHGFVTMYSFRLVYYLIWHIVWGYARLGILFGG